MKKDTDRIILKRKVGGSIVHRRPVFTADEKYLCVIEKECVRVYSTNSGECALEFYPPDEMKCDIVGIGVHNNFVFGVSSKGDLILWSLESPVKRKVLKLNLPITVYQSVFDLVVVDQGNADDENRLVELVVLMSNVNEAEIAVCFFNANTMKKTYQTTVKARSNTQSITFGGCYNKMFIGTIHSNKVFIYQRGREGVVNKILSPDYKVWTVIRAHPYEDCIAVGNKLGRIMIYYNVTKDSCLATMTVYAWHTLPVGDLIFSPNGTRMFSGGSECVLVKWTLDTSSVRHFLPRLPAPIVHFSISPMSTHIAVSLQNNSILLVNQQLDVGCSIQQFTWGLTPVPGQPLFPAGICHNRSTDSLILNGRPGHIQFFSLKTNNLLYNLDITKTNYITQEPGTEIINLDVTRVAISEEGKWLATVETRCDHETSPEIYMKIWAFDEVNQSFKLNTYCDWPHQDFINTVKFQPINSLDNEVRSEYCLVTTGNDNKFRIWLTVASQVENKKYTVWKCERIGFYKDYPAGPAGFSSDGSVLAVGFGPCLTIWDADNHDLVASLARDNNTLTFVEIEQKHYSHLAVATSSSQLYVWNLLTLTLLWTVPLKVSILVADPLSEFMAAFTDDNTLYVFKPSEPQPVYQKQNVYEEGKALAAVFVPQESAVKTTAGTPSWMHNSKLYFLTSLQELLCAEVDDESMYKDSLKQFNFNDAIMDKTPYAALKAKQTKVVEEDSGSVYKQHRPVGLVAESAIRKLLSAPNHAMAPLNMLCKDFLKSFIPTLSAKKPIETEKLSKKKKKKRNKLKKIIERRQKDEFQQIFGKIDADIESMDIDVPADEDSDQEDGVNSSLNNLLRGFESKDSGDDIEDEQEEEEEKDKSTVKDVVNRMFHTMKRQTRKGVDKNTTKKKKKSRERRRSKSNFVIDDTADFGLLNLFKSDEN